MRFAPLAMLPRSVIGLGREVLRHLLRRPVVGICAAAHTADGRWLLIRRGDTGTWALPGGTLEWGEPLALGIQRELEEEAGVTSARFERVVGVYSRPDRDPRFHAVTIVVAMEIEPPTRAPMNSLEIRDVGLFAADELPKDFAMGADDMLRDARAGGPATFE